MRCTALIVAAGRGERMGSALPKAYLELGGAPILRRSVLAMLAHERIAEVRVVYDPACADAYRAAVGDLGLREPVPGGRTRQASVRCGLEALALDPPDLVLVHDAARPFATSALLGRVLDALSVYDAVVPALPVTDSLKSVSGDAVLAAVPRDGLVRAQTPQGFRFPLLLEAHRRCAAQDLTDDAAVVAAAGIEVAWVLGEEANVKLTTPEDLRLAQGRLERPRCWRSGIGLDIHAFAPGRRLVLGGVEIPHDQGLEGHSDADVLLHALTDALLGTIAAGDIGTHFPPSDPRWRDACSARFVGHARRLVEAEGGRIEHVDLSLLCERPKIGPYRGAIQARIGELLGLPPGRVGLKATTAEGLGFVGRREGVVAQALATVSFPA